MFYETMEELLPDLKVIIDNGSGTQTMLPLEPFANVTEGTSGNQTPQAAAPAGSKRGEAYEKTGRKIALFIILIAGLITLGSSMVSTYNDEYKLVLQFGKVVRVIDTPRPEL